MKMFKALYASIVVSALFTYPSFSGNRVCSTENIETYIEGRFPSIDRVDEILSARWQEQVVVSITGVEIVDISKYLSQLDDLVHQLKRNGLAISSYQKDTWPNAAFAIVSDFSKIILSESIAKYFKKNDETVEEYRERNGGIVEGEYVRTKIETGVYGQRKKSISIIKESTFEPANSSLAREVALVVAPGEEIQVSDNNVKKIIDGYYLKGSISPLTLAYISALYGATLNNEMSLTSFKNNFVKSMKYTCEKELNNG